MKKLSIILAAVLMLSLTGCQLARTDIESTGDKLVGVLITPEYLDLFDMEAYLNDNLQNIGKDLVLRGDTSDYQGRIYASLAPTTLRGENGEIIEDTELYFHDLEGLHLVAARMEQDDEAYNRVYTSDGLLHTKTAYNYGDAETSISLESEVWLIHTDGDLTTYINPVYQDSEGRYYVTAGQGLSTNGDNATGICYTQTLEDKRTISVNGERRTEAISISISIGSMYEPEKYVLLQLDKNNQILQQDTYIPGSMPEKLTPQSDTAYLILETHNPDATTNLKVTRDIFSPDTDHIPTYYGGEQGFIMEDHTFIQWDH